MSFVSLLKDDKTSDKEAENVSLSASEHKIIENEVKKPEQLLRSAGLKIKLITRTAFGVQIDFPKKYEEDDIKSTLSDFNIKIKGNSVFIVE